MHITVVTPEQLFLKKECQSVTVPGELGEMQILPGHINLLAELRQGVVTVKDDKEEQQFSIDHGFVEVSEDQVNLLCDKVIG
jgi:F-type H+-transporting ATPase subunit epsilon